MMVPATERVIDVWKAVYTNCRGNRFSGRLTVTSNRLVYEADFGSYGKGIIGLDLFARWGTEERMIIPKSRIRRIDVQKRLFSGRAVLTLDDDSLHFFDSGIFCIKLLAVAIQRPEQLIK